MWIKYNANPVANRTEDCAIRAVAVALDIPWDDAFDQIARMAKNMAPDERMRQELQRITTKVEQMDD